MSADVSEVTSTQEGPLTHDEVMAAAERMEARGTTEPRLARDPVNQPQINTWLDAIGDRDPRWSQGEAPPAMAQVWTMPGLAGKRSEDDPLHGMMTVLDRAGYTSVLGTNCDQTYDRSLSVGERVSITTELDSVVGPKTTGVGEGYFVTTRAVWRVGEEQVAAMLFRVLKFKPAKRSASPDLTDPSRTVRPMANRDTAYFWEGASAGELRIQRCDSCQALRHPPGPLCPGCGAADRGYVVATGSGVVHSYVVHHAPPIPGKRLPMVVAVVTLDEGVRMIGEVPGVDPAGVDDSLIGTRVQVDFDRIDDELTLPVWRVTEDTDETDETDDSAHPHAVSSHRWDLPVWELPITTTLVVSTALATRDFQDVHHDRDLARSHGSKDVFLNILTTTGLVQRYVGEWAGPGAVVRACELRLGAPAHPGDTLVFAGRVTDVVEVDGESRQVVEVVGSVPMGAHVMAAVTVTLPGETLPEGGPA